MRSKRRQRARIFRKVCGWLSGLSAFYCYGIVGALDCNTIDLVPGVVHIFSSLALAVVFGQLAGIFEW